LIQDRGDDLALERAQRLDTGSESFNKLLGGGLATSAITDVYGAAATGKTQFAFQNSVLSSSLASNAEKNGKPRVVFVDCAGSFRPERVAEIAEERGSARPSEVLDQISTIYVRTVAGQKEASEQILSSDHFDRCKLLVVDDITTNFVAEFPGDKEHEENTYVSRYLELSSYVRKLAYIALTRKLAVLLTNSVRSRLSDENKRLNSVEVETIGDIISQFALFRLHFTSRGTIREGRIVQPFVQNPMAQFRIEKRGVVP
jgi:RecA/RadA recombinase